MHLTDWETSQTAYVNLALDIEYNIITQKQKNKKRKKKRKIECETLMGKIWSLSEIYRKKVKMYKKVYNLQKVKQKKCTL